MQNSGSIAVTIRCLSTVGTWAIISACLQKNHCFRFEEIEMDAISLSWNWWETPRNDSVSEEKCCNSSETSESTEIRCINLNNFQNGQRTKSFNDISNQKMISTFENASKPGIKEPYLQQSSNEQWNITSSDSITPSLSYECVSNLCVPNNMGMTASCSNISARTASYFRKCNSTASLPSVFLDQMIDQLQEKGIKIPAKDRKILELMISRHENYIDERERSNSSHRNWEMEKFSAKERQKREEMRHRQHILHKLQAERKLRDLKKLEQLDKEQADIQEKEKFLKFKTEKWKDRWDMQETARKEAFLRIKMRDDERRKSQEQYLHEKQEVEELSKRYLAMDSECRLVKSLQSRQCQEVELLIKLKKENIESEEKHALRMKEVQQHFREKMDMLKEDLETKECITSKNRQDLLRDLEMKYRREAEKRRRRAQRVHHVLEKLERSNQRWFDEIVSYQQYQLKLAEERAQRHIENRAFSVREDRKQRMHRHDRQMQEIQNQEKRDLLLAAQKLNLKDRKCEHLAMEKESKILQSRQTAQASSDLRERLKWVLEQDMLGRKFPLLDLHSQMNTAPPSELSTFN